MLEARDPRLADVTITAVDITPDLMLARVSFTVMAEGDEKVSEAQAGLERATGFLRTQLAARLQLRFMPHLAFELDKSAAYGRRIDELLVSLPKKATIPSPTTAHADPPSEGHAGRSRLGTKAKRRGMSNSLIKAVEQLISPARRILLIAHVWPDAIAIGSLLAMGSLLRIRTRRSLWPVKTRRQRALRGFRQFRSSWSGQRIHRPRHQPSTAAIRTGWATSMRLGSPRCLC